MATIAPPKKGFNDYKIIDEKTTELYIKNKNGDKFTVFVDTEDITRLINADHSWHTLYDKVLQQYYIKTTITYYDENGKRKQNTLYLHKFLLDYKGNHKYIDHKNHNTLDNRKDNLIIIGQKSNSKNRLGANKNTSTGVRNLCWSNSANRYLVQFQIEGKNTCFGTFKSNEFNEAVEFTEKYREKIYGKELEYLNK